MYLVAVRNSPAGVALGKAGAGMPGENDAVAALRGEAEVRCPPTPKGPSINDVTLIFGVFGPPPPLVRDLG